MSIFAYINRYLILLDYYFRQKEKCFYHWLLYVLNLGVWRCQMVMKPNHLRCRELQQKLQGWWDPRRKPTWSPPPPSHSSWLHYLSPLLIHICPRKTEGFSWYGAKSSVSSNHFIWKEMSCFWSLISRNKVWYMLLILKDFINVHQPLGGAGCSFSE